MKKKIRIALIIIIYSALLIMIVYYAKENKERKKVLTDRVNALEPILNEYYQNSFGDDHAFGKLFVFPGETDIEFDETGIMSGEAFISTEGKFEIALYDGKFCATKKTDEELTIKKTSISSCIVNK